MARPSLLASALAALVGFALVLGGCAAPTEPVRAHAPEPAPVRAATPTAPAAIAAVPAAPSPAAPAKAAPELPPATIVGSEETSTMFDNFTVYVAAVDGHPVAASRDSWNIAHRVTPGRHRLTVVFTRGVFTARTELPIDAKPGASYQVKFATDAQVFGQNSYCDFWIENTKGASEAYPRTRAPLQRVAKTD